MKYVLCLWCVCILLSNWISAHHGTAEEHHNTEHHSEDHEHSHQNMKHRSHGKYHMKFFPWKVRYLTQKPEEIHVFNIQRYSNWSSWSECLPVECIEVRYRKCLDDSWKTLLVNKVRTTKCISKYYAEKRTCLNKTQCQSYTGNQIIQNLTDTCGIRPQGESIKTKILGGQPSTPHSWPWAVRLSVQPPQQDSITFCGGTLIASQWVLTAAHCVLIENKRIPVGRPVALADYMKSAIYAHLGDHDKFEDEKYQTDHPVSVAILHPKYHRKLQTDGYDIALLRLSKPVEISPQVSFACLPPEDLTIKPGTKCYAVGWGSNTGASEPTFDNLQSILDSIFMPIPDPFGVPFMFPKRREFRQLLSKSDESAKELHEVELPIISMEQCRRHYFDISDNVHICAGSKGKDTCAGDSGGGLYCQLPENDRWFVVGVTSFGLARGCGLNPGVYTSTAAHLDWVSKQMGSKIY